MSEPPRCIENIAIENFSLFHINLKHIDHLFQIELGIQPYDQRSKYAGYTLNETIYDTNVNYSLKA